MLSLRLTENYLMWFSMKKIPDISMPTIPIPPDLQLPNKSIQVLYVIIGQLWAEIFGN